MREHHALWPSSCAAGIGKHRHVFSRSDLDGRPGAIGRLHKTYYLHRTDLQPHVFMRMTDNWIELAVRFIVPERGTREMKDKITREILAAFEEAGIEIASTTFEVVGLPPLRITRPEPARS